MASVNDNLVNSIALVIKATDKINEVTGGRDAIVRKSASGGSAVAEIVLNSVGQSSSKTLEAGKGRNLNTSA